MKQPVYNIYQKNHLIKTQSYMKPIFYIILVFTAVLLNACDSKDESYFSQENPSLNLDIKSVSSVQFNDQVTISGVASSPNAIRDISFYLVKKTDSGYSRLWFSPLQYADITISKSVNFSGEVRVDDPDADAIAVIANDPYGHQTTEYITIGQIEGSPEGSAHVFRDMEITTEYEYGTSAPYIFSLDGVNVGGNVKHIVSLDDIKQTQSKNAHIAFTSIWRNTTTYTSGVLGNWGYAFCEFRQLSRGPVGRQCDFIYLTGSANAPAGVDTCSLVLVPSATASINNFDQVFEYAGDNFGTSNFLNLLSPLFNNTYANMYVINMKTNASGVNTAACNELAKNGDYIAFRLSRNGVFTYGLLKIEQLPDASDILLDGGNGKYITEPYEGGVVNNTNLPKKWYDSASAEAVGIAKLFGRTAKISVIAQK